MGRTLHRSGAKGNDRRLSSPLPQFVWPFIVLGVLLNESRTFRGWYGNETERRNCDPTEADGGSRRASDHLAHYEMLCTIWSHRLYCAWWLPGRIHSSVFFEFQNAFFRLYDRPIERRNSLECLSK